MKWVGHVAHMGWKIQIKYYLDSPKRKEDLIVVGVNENKTSEGILNSLKFCGLGASCSEDGLNVSA